MPIRILIADDHEVLRMGLRASFDEVTNIDVVAEAVDGVSAIAKTIELLPDLVLMDISMPRLDGIAATRQLKARLSQINILILTSHDNKDDIFAALTAGADGYCMKDAPKAQLILAVETVASGAAWIDPKIARLILSATIAQHLADAEFSANAPRKLITALSARESEVLVLLVEGRNNQEVAKKLVISGETVKTHVRHILQKLEVNDRTQAVIRAMREKLV